MLSKLNLKNIKKSIDNSIWKITKDFIDATDNYKNVYYNIKDNNYKNIGNGVYYINKRKEEKTLWDKVKQETWGDVRRNTEIISSEITRVISHNIDFLIEFDDIRNDNLYKKLRKWIISNCNNSNKKIFIFKNKEYDFSNYDWQNIKNLVNSRKINQTLLVFYIKISNFITGRFNLI